MCVQSVQVTVGRPAVQKQGCDRRGREKETRSESNGGTDKNLRSWHPVPSLHGK